MCYESPAERVWFEAKIRSQLHCGYIRDGKHKRHKFSIYMLKLSLKETEELSADLLSQYLERGGRR